MFKTVVVGGVSHELTPSPRNLDSFLHPALVKAGLQPWFDAGLWASVEEKMMELFPSPKCPVETTIDCDGEWYPKWPLWYPGDDLVEVAEEFKEDYLKYIEWCGQYDSRSQMLGEIRQVVETYGQYLRKQILNQVVADLEKEIPGYVRELVLHHCKNGHVCSCSEHDVALDSL